MAHCHLFTVLWDVYRGSQGGRCTEITVPGNISQWSGIQSSAVWHFSTDCWPAVSGVARPHYLLPGLKININQASFIRLGKLKLRHQSNLVWRKYKLLSYFSQKLIENVHFSHSKIKIKLLI